MLRVGFVILLSCFFSCSSANRSKTESDKRLEGHWKSKRETKALPGSNEQVEIEEPLNNFVFRDGKALRYWANLDTVGAVWLPYFYNESDSLILIGGNSIPEVIKRDYINGGLIIKAYFISAEKLLVLQPISFDDPSKTLNHIMYLERNSE